MLDECRYVTQRSTVSFGFHSKTSLIHFLSEILTWFVCPKNTEKYLVLALRILDDKIALQSYFEPQYITAPNLYGHTHDMCGLTLFPFLQQFKSHGKHSRERRRDLCARYNRDR